ncbi:protein of unknown function DUF112 transmembrane [Methanocaldococcus infernus ME]|uniref:DUF112 domain-containing protein n=1 Tax=Methanocaldococcus infernus (strain DSM 11812 / JCM 15783 / ME) TaxID=573063 RepID=D5VQG6_METIM|nr:tripartite tricarboxylate transporter permease [Methanocaldococcus infernus]ADG12819.1 protein of unknown function DUF112 transmembrane [Methanocaldococcus infernus ME]
MVIYIILGSLCGIFTGLIPGIHPNNIVALSFIFSPLLGENYPYFLVSLVITHYFINFIPSALLGVPDDETAMSVLPMHKLTLKGRAYEAIFLAGLGSFLGVIFSLVISLIIVLLSFDINKVYLVIKPFLPIILSLFILHQILTSKNIYDLLTIFLSGIFGIIIFYLNPSFNSTLTAVFTGMFGIPLLLNNLKEQKFITQHIKEVEFKLSYLKSIFFSSVVGFFRMFLPAVSGAQLNYILGKIIKEEDIENFLVSQGSIVLSNEVFSLLAVFFIGTGRSGTAKALETLNLNLLSLLLATFLASTLAFIILINLSKYLIKVLQRVNFKVVSVFFIFLSSSIVIIISYNHLLYHLVVYLTSIAIGLIATRGNMSNMINVLTFPTILMLVKP